VRCAGPGGPEFKSEQIRRLPQCCFRRLKIVSEFYQETHAILMRRGVRASARELQHYEKAAPDKPMRGIKISFSILHFFFMTRLRY
jgi:hypothetical protein